MATNDEMRKELERMQQEINQRTDDSLESTRRMVKSVNEAEDAGIKTVDKLHLQGEQLENVDSGLDKVSENMKEAEKNLDQMEKCCGMCICPWNKMEVLTDEEIYSKVKGDTGNSNKVVTKQPRRERGKRTKTKTSDSKFIDKITYDVRENEMEENLEDVDNKIVNLKDIAVDMGNDLGKQNQMIDSINVKTDRNKEKVTRANKRADKILNS